MSVALSIVFTGLCALVTDGGGREPGQVLLLDAKGAADAGGVGFPQHTPMLVASLRDLANPDSSGPTRVVLGPDPAGGDPLSGVTQIGIWDLTGSVVRVRVPGRRPSKLEQYQPADGTSSWPEPPRVVNDARSWRDIRFVPSLNLLVDDARLRPALVSSIEETVLPDGIAGRVVLEGGSVEAGLPSEEAYRSQVLEFRGAGGTSRLRQAVTDTLRWNLERDDGPIVVEVIPVSGGPVKRLVFAAAATPRRVFVSNLPSDNGSGHAGHAHAGLDERLAAPHFDAYYALLEERPADPPVPRVSAAPTGRRGTGLMRPLICTPIRFDRN